MKIFLAGSTGVIGRQLVPLLVKAGHEVVGMTRDPSRAGSLRALGARPVVADVFDRDSLFVTIERERPDVIIHQLTSLRTWDYAANACIRREGTRNLVDAGLVAGVQRVIAQSYCVYAPADGLAREEDPLDFESSRHATVEGIWSLESTVAEVPQGVVLRYGTLYGSGTRYDRNGEFAEQVRRGEIPTSDDIMSFLDVEDAAHAAVLALGWPKGVWNIVDDEPAPDTEWLPLYAALIGAPPPPSGPKSGHPRRGVSNARARHELGWQPLHPSWREGFKRTLAA